MLPVSWNWASSAPLQLTQFPPNFFPAGLFPRLSSLPSAAAAAAAAAAAEAISNLSDAAAAAAAAARGGRGGGEY